MADLTISGMTAASTLDGTELVEVEQGGNSRKSTVDAVATRVAAKAQTWSGAQQFGQVAGTATAVASLAIDCSLGNFFTKTIATTSTFTVSNVPSSKSYGFTLLLTYTSGTITWFSGVNWAGGAAPTFTGGKKYLIVFHTNDGGTTWRAASGEFAA